MAEPISASSAGEVREAPSAYEAGNEADFERLYQASYGKILGTLTAMLGDRAAAEDCAQDAFERAYKKWATWQPIAPAEAWVHRIAIVLRHYHGYTNRAIAQALGIPERTVASRLAVAKERLRVMLKHSYGPQADLEPVTERGFAVAD
ncbi:MAG: hypothetical protein AUG84_01210 [Chloroflexi bacterium 13_1_20CM_4_66_7]|nr:MAG: hypothetical protein AUG84_01210 [Chloroflexi bacterium 13_1_20CM_4_66_7]